jgi:hypothetical protein
VQALVGLKDVRVLYYERRGREVDLVIEQVVTDPRCPGCGGGVRVKERPVVRYVDLPVFGTPMHLAWRKQHADLKELPIPMLADTKRELSSALGILTQKEGVALRATFIVDPAGVIRWVSVNDLNVGRSVPETLRVLDALQTDELCPCNWKQGEETLKAA